MTAVLTTYSDSAINTRDDRLRRSSRVLIALSLYVVSTAVIASTDNYTIGLLGSIPRIEEAREALPAIEGMVPPPFDLPPGCRFAPRCVFADAACGNGVPELRDFGGGHAAACLLAPVDGGAGRP